MNSNIQFKGKSISTGEWKYGYYYYSCTWKRHVIVTSKDGQDVFNFVDPDSVQMIDLDKEILLQNSPRPHVCQRFPDNN